ncbi:MAG: sulfite exporter TauE/SafE family protein, partial [Oscillibacter sp.]|nr:sulfite exporter TauE/SafE family protein [Oscillibacter sp.]
MTLEPVHFLIICPLAFLSGFVDTVAGGGGLISLPAYLIAGLPVHAAVGTNKVSSAMGSAVAVQQFAGKGYIPWRQSGFYIVCALIGSGLGANLALAMDDTAFKCIMLMILPVTAIYILRSKHRLTMVNTPLNRALGVRNQIFHSNDTRSAVA